MYPEQCPQGSIAVAYPLTFSHARDGDTVNREPPAAHVFFSQHLHHPLGVDAQQQQYESQLVSHIQPLMPWHPSTYGDLGQAFSDHWPPNHYTSPTEYCELASANHLQIQHMRGKTKRASLVSFYTFRRLVTYADFVMPAIGVVNTNSDATRASRVRNAEAKTLTASTPTEGILEKTLKLFSTCS